MKVKTLAKFTGLYVAFLGAMMFFDQHPFGWERPFSIACIIYMIIVVICTSISATRSEKRHGRKKL